MPRRTSGLAIVALATAILCAPVPAPAQVAAGDLGEQLKQIRALLYDKLDSARAETDARALLLTVEARYGADSAETAAVLDVLVEVLSGGNPFYYPNRKPTSEAVELGRRALRLKELHFGADDPQTALTLHRLAIALRLQSMDAEAKADYERALAIQETKLAPNDPALADTHVAYAAFLRSRDDWAMAQAHLERALQVYESAYGPEHQRVAAVCALLGAHLRELGEYSTATDLLARSLAIREKVYGPEDPDVAGSLNSLAGVYFLRGDWPEADRLLGRSIAITEKQASKNQKLGVLLYNRGHMLRQIGDRAGARSAYERGLAIMRTVEGSESSNAAAGLADLANISMDEGDLAAARRLEQSALAMREKLEGPQSASLALDLDSLAEILAKSSQLSEAIAAWKRGLEILEKPGTPPNWRARLLEHMAAALEASDAAAARNAYEDALTIYRKETPEGSPAMGRTLARLARVRARMGENEEAFRESLRAEEMARNHMRLTIGAVSERQALAYAASRESGLDLALSLPLAGPETWAAWDAVVRARALVLDEMAARHHTFNGSKDPEIRALGQQFASARERLANLAVRGAGDNPARYRLMLDRARQQRETAEQALLARSSSFRREREQSRKGLKEVVAALPADSALVAFVLFKQYPLAMPPTGSSAATPAYAVFVLRSGSRRPDLVRLGTAETIDHLVAQWGEQIAREALAAGHGARRSEAEYRRVAGKLRKAVWDPIAPQVAGAKQIFVVPDGTLHLVNFGALPSGVAGYLIERHQQLHYLAAERDLAVEAAAATSNVLLAVGAPAFDEAPALVASGVSAPGAAPDDPTPVFRGHYSSCGSFQGMRFSALPASEREGQIVARLWSGRNLLLRGTEHPDVLYLSGARATETAFKLQAPGKRVLHIATHGFFLGGRCTSALAADDATKAGGENPLLLSGVVFAGANARAQAAVGQDDGILTAEEISALDLEGVEWAVLSGCDTGVGEVRAGEGVLGLRRAFQVAGVHTVIMSLWPVEDEGTRQWMHRLYAARLRGQSTVQAVSTASLQSLAARRARAESTHPFYWAGFVAAGDWR